MRWRTSPIILWTPDFVTDIDDNQIDEFIDTHAPLDPQMLEPKLWNRFLRITLVSKTRPERLTLDLNLEFGWDDRYAAMPGIAIAEVKQEHLSQHSDFTQQMREFSVRPTRFSKYCAGVYSLYSHQAEQRQISVTSRIGQGTTFLLTFPSGAATA